MRFSGRAHRFTPNDDINTDYIISGRYKFRTNDMDELAKHVMEDISPDFSRNVRRGDLVVAGTNFGCGSSREQAPRALKAAGVSAVVAESFARIFYRNSFNVGLPLVQCETDRIADGADIEIDLIGGYVMDLATGERFVTTPLPSAMIALLQDGGLVPHLKRHGGFELD